MKTNRQKIEDVLLEIDHNRKNLEVTPKDDHDVVKFGGQIGPNVTFDGVWYKAHNYVYRTFTDHAEIDLANKGKKLAKISAEFNFDKGCRGPVRSVFAEPPVYSDGPLALVDDINEITVTSPAWQENYSVKTVTQENNKKLSIQHSPDEAENAVVDKICRAVAHSKSLGNVMEKLHNVGLSMEDLEYALKEFNGSSAQNKIDTDEREM